MTSDPAALTQDLPPPRISEIVLRSSNYDAMKVWYQQALGIKPFMEYVPPDWETRGGRIQEKLDTDVRLCFMRVHNDFPYTQVLALFDVAHLAPSDRASGLHHMQFRNASLEVLLTRYERLRSIGIRPYKSFNHGPATSFYYEDHDGNLVELSASNYPTEAEFLAYFQTPAFRSNPAGIAIDPDDFVGRFRDGMPQADLVRIAV